MNIDLRESYKLKMILNIRTDYIWISF